MTKPKREPLELIEGETYANTNGTRQRRIVGFSGYFVLYKTVGSPRQTTGVAIWDFQKWARSIVKPIEPAEATVE